MGEEGSDEASLTLSHCRNSVARAPGLKGLLVREGLKEKGLLTKSENWVAAGFWVTTVQGDHDDYDDDDDAPGGGEPFCFPSFPQSES